MAIPSIIHESWHEHIEDLFNIPELVELNTQILPNQNFYPKRENIFRVFEMPLDKIRVVILGQDPYPNFAQATGLAFAVPQHIKTPPSLQVIQRELINEKIIPSTDDKDFIFDKTLVNWFHQGVFLLNTSLTVKANEAGSHKPYWDKFIRGVVHIIASEVKPIWLLWGAHAREMGWEVFEHHEAGRVSGSLPNRTMSCSHPATEMYPNSKGGYYGCNHFTKVNNLLRDNGKSTINWK